MLKPTRYTNPQLGVLNIAAALLEIFKDEKSWNIIELSKKVSECLDAECDTNFLYALNLLYLTGKIEYNLNADTIEFLKK
jgi:hypothetical protein